jgi:hypothetical protein
MRTPLWPLGVQIGSGFIFVAAFARLILGHFNERIIVIGILGMAISWIAYRGLHFVKQTSGDKKQGRA